jgi:NAD(P)H-dependent FMN reductase
MPQTLHPRRLEPFQLAVIVGSVREGRSGAVIANWFVTQAAKRTDVRLDVVDLRDVAPLSPAPVEVASRLAVADAFVVVTPEYNRSFPAALKHMIDRHDGEWHAKPVAFVSYGGRSGGLCAVEQLRSVFAELHAVTIRSTVSFHGQQDRFDEEGQPADPARSNGAAKSMLDQLLWWAHALRDARTARPYVSASRTYW